MPEPHELVALGNAAVVAPAGHGKTEIITSIAALGRRALILTHTHAGVHAIRARLKRHGRATRRNRDLHASAEGLERTRDFPRPGRARRCARHATQNRFVRMVCNAG